MPSDQVTTTHEQDDGAGFGAGLGATAQQELHALLEATNQASASARNTWVFFVGMMAYFFVALASVTHRDLLLEAPVTLPILNVDIALYSFFGFAPFVLLLMHFWILIQHVMLARKVRALDQILSETQQDDRLPFRGLSLRLQLHPYFFTQILADPPRSLFLSFCLHAMLWTTLVLLPVCLFLGFQIRFLPYHDAAVTLAQRLYLAVDVFLILGIGVFMRRPDAGFFATVGDTLWRRPLSFVSAGLIMMFSLFFSFCVATIPDSSMDKAMSKVWPATLPLGSGSKRPEAPGQRVVFWPTAYVFEHRLLSRNLSVVREDLVADAEWEPKEVSIRLNDRDLRYASLIASDLHRANFSGADLSSANLRGASLQGAKFSRRTILNGTSFYGANLQNADLRLARAKDVSFGRAKLNGANLSLAELSGVNFWDADLRGANLNTAVLNGVRFQRANLQHINLNQARLQGAQFNDADARGASIRHASLQGADLSDANLQGADLSASKMHGARLHRARLQGAVLEHADFSGADFNGTKIWRTSLTIENLPNMKSRNWRLADLTKAQVAPISAQDRQDLLDLIDETKDRRRAARLRERLAMRPGASNESDNGAWQDSDVHRIWLDLVQATPDERELSVYLAELACKSLPRRSRHLGGGKVPHLLRGIAKRVGDPNLRTNANPVAFLESIQSCGAFDKLSDRTKRSFEVTIQLYKRRSR